METPFDPAWLEAHRVRVTDLVRREAIVGIGHVMQEVESLVGRLRDPARTAALGATPPRGLLFWGQPGVGKTLVARYVAGAIGDVPIYELSCDELGPERVRALFAHLAQAHARCVLYLDEIDLIGLHRARYEHSSATRATLVALLAALDGLRDSAGPILIAASNRPPIQLDPALLRAGRLGYHVAFDLPDVDERAQLLALFLAGRPHEPDIDVAALARLAPDATPAALRQAVDDAAGLALARDATCIAHADLRAALGRDGEIVPEAPPFDPTGHARAACHEAGHVAAAVALRGTAWVGEVILADGGGHTALADIDGDRDRVPSDVLRDRLVVLAAGREAEALLTGAASLGARHDAIAGAQLAEELVTAGLVAGPGFPAEVLQNTSEVGAAGVTSAVAGHLAEARLRAARIVWAQRDALRRFVEALLAAEGVLAGTGLEEAIRASGLDVAEAPAHGGGPFDA